MAMVKVAKEEQEVEAEEEAGRAVAN